MSLRRLIGSLHTLAFFTSLPALTTLAAAQYTARPTPLPASGRTMVGNADSSAMVQNPANLAFLPGPELRWSGAFADEDAPLSTQGHAIGFALPFGFIPLTMGLRFDMLNPTSEVTDATLG